jgi:hypothetical protein
MNIWLDDVRPMPAGFDVHVKTASEAIELIKNSDGVESISFDHDLGNDEDGTGYDVATYIEMSVYLRHHPPPRRWAVHSANPVGREKIKRAMESADRLFESWDDQLFDQE